MSATPILDLEKEPPAARLGTKGVLIGLALGAGIGMMRTSESLPALNLALLVPAMYLAVALHELGHLAAGQMVGMPPGGIVIGGFMLLKSGAPRGMHGWWRVARLSAWY